ncbi:hypothetical protein FB382_000316 [Nocardioides ginsengisegetis]|uniref:WD40-like Beta Propeller Repeat n=1 Tax=Nocardioides ginsengisegetis TaxID=661491 RepID=A0A7W3IWP5_9ACTN|nr:hypothetical protein [Nocardioides ginsengisegetis]MBA8802025.1 hypothetical protein [Nocardioides ginsengisegetis]
MSDLRTRLDDLVDDVPTHVAPDVRGAWAAGARRRNRRRAGVVATAAAVLALVSAVAAGVPRVLDPGPTDASPRGGVGSYPTRIDRPQWTRSWSDVHGLGAGLLRSGGTWYVVSPDGALRRMDHAGTQVAPAISPDGRYVAWLDTGYGQAGIEVTDLTTGSTSSHDVGLAGSNSQWIVAEGARMVWSPDSRQVLVPARRRFMMTPPNPAAVVLDVDGRLRSVQERYPSPQHVSVVGWQGPRRLVWLAWRDGSGVPATGLKAIVTDRRGHDPRTVPVTVDGDTGHLATTSASISPDGGTLALGADLAQEGVQIRFYSLTGPTTGHLRGTMPAVVDGAADCPPSWGDELQVPAAESYRDAALVSVNGGVTVLADPRLHVTCSVWATDALTGAPHRGVGGWLFGDSTSWLSWHWRETSEALVGALVLATGLVLLRRRRRGPHASHGSHRPGTP